MSNRLHRSLSVTLGLAASLTAWSCQAPTPVTLEGMAPSMTLNATAAVARLSGKAMSDFSLSLVGGADRFGRGQQAAARHVQAFGDAAANWSSPFTPMAGGAAVSRPGVALTLLGCTATDKATNGAAIKYMPPERLIVVTREGKLLDLNPANPTLGAVVTNLDNAGAASTFTRTYVSLSSDASLAFVVSDEGSAYAIDLDTVTAGAHPVKRLALGQGVCVGTAAFVDPLVSAGRDSTMYAVSNAGVGMRVKFTPGANWAGSTFTASSLGKLTPITSAITGTELVKSAPVALGGVVVVGDRRGNLNLLNTNGGALRTWSINASWPIETPPAVDVDDNLAITDVFVAAGPKLSWVQPATNAVRHGLNALVDKRAGAGYGRITVDNVDTYLDSTEQTIGTDWNNRDAFSLYDTDSAGASLPGAPGPLDINHLSYGTRVTGQPPVVNAWAGVQGQTSPRVAEGTAFTAARFNAPYGLDWDTDGSVYVANRDGGQVIVKPNSTATVSVWTGQNYPVDPNRWYELAGTNDVGGGQPLRDYGARGTFTYTRATRLNKVRDIAVGNRGMYIAVGTDGWQGGALLFLPKNGVTSAFGFNGLQPLNLYVLSRNCDPTGLAVDRRTANKDIVYLSSSHQIGEPYTTAVLKMDSTSNADVSVLTNSRTDDPSDVAVDDKGNVLIADPGGTPEVLMHYVGGAGNTRTWGIGSPSANTTYAILSGTPNLSIWNLCFGANDPQSPGGCLYLASTQWGNAPHTLYRLDNSGAYTLLGGAANTAGATGDGGAATAARFNGPRGVATDGVGNVYIADTGNQRIRKLTIPSFTGPEALGFMRFNISSYLERPILAATLTLTSRTKDKLPAPLVGVASPYLPGTTTLWSADNVSATNVPEVNFLQGAATPNGPNISGQGIMNLNVNEKVTYVVPPGAFPAGSATYLALGLKAPDDGKDYFYPTSLDVPSSADRAFDFHTPRSDSGNAPQLRVRFGQTYVVRPILSPPAIYGTGANRRVFVANGNSLFRYAASSANQAAFSASVDFTHGRVARFYSDGAKTQNPKTSYQPNAAPPFVDYSGRVHTLDVRFQNWDNAAFYALNGFNGVSTNENMAIGGGGLYKDIHPMDQYAERMPSNADDNSGIYMVSDFALADVYFGLSNGRLYRLGLQ